MVSSCVRYEMIRKLLSSFILLFTLFLVSCSPNVSKKKDNGISLGFLLGFETSHSVQVQVKALYGSGLVLTNNYSDNLSVSSDGTYSFSKALNTGSSYHVGVSSQPTSPTQYCIVQNGDGIVQNTSVTSIIIDCSAKNYTMSVVVQDMESSGSYSLVLDNNGTDSLTITSNGTYTFSTPIFQGGGYDVTINSQPANHTCVVLGTAYATVTGNASVTVNCMSIIGGNPALGSPVSSTQTITFTFSSNVAAGCTVSGLGTVGTSSMPASNQLQITPSTSWTLGTDSVTFSGCNSAIDGNSLSSSNFRINVVNGIYYVSSNSGSNLTCTSALNSISNPCDSIINLIAGTSSTSCASSTCGILVEDGNYSPTATLSLGTTSGAYSLYGGYVTGSSFSQRDISSYNTIIQGTNYGCGSTPSTACSVITGPATASSTIEGFLIRTVPGVGYSFGIYMHDSSGLIRYNKIEISDSNGNSGAQVGIHLFTTSGSTAGPVNILSNIISGTSCTSTCIQLGISWQLAGAQFANIAYNNISGASGATGTSTSTGIAINGAYSSSTIASVITGNMIYGGDAPTSWGVLLTGSSWHKLFLTGNDIAGGNATVTSKALALSGATLPFVIQNNHLMTKSNTASSPTSYCIFANSGASLTSLQGNNLFHCGTALYYDGTNNLNSICTSGTVGNIAQDTTCTLNAIAYTSSGNHNIDGFTTHVFRNLSTSGSIDLRYDSNSPCLLTQSSTTNSTPAAPNQTNLINHDATSYNRLSNSVPSVGLYDWDGSCQ